MNTLIILNDPPYGTERCYNGLRLANALLAQGPEADIAVFLMADAVGCAKRGQRVPDGYYNLERMVGRLIRAGGQVLLCGTCMEVRGMDEAELVEGGRRSTLDDLSARTQAADKVLVF